MRCPKCHYLSFDPEPRCKNCGYDLEVADAELAFKAAEDYSDSIPDLELRRTEPENLAPVTLELRRETPEIDRAPAAPRVARPRKRAPVVASDEDDVWPARSTPAPSVPERVVQAREAVFRIEPVREDNVEPEPVPAPIVAASTVPARRERTWKPALVAEREPIAAAEPEPVVESQPTPVAAVPAESAPTATSPGVPFVVAKPSVSAHPTTELPLFVRDAPAPPRAPLAVRRTVAEPLRGRTTTSTVSTPAKDLRVGPLDRDLLDDLRRVEREEAAYATVQARVRRSIDTVDELEEEFDGDLDDVPATQRMAAAALDGALLGAIGSVALWATLRVTGAGIASFGTDAIVAFLIFLGGVSVAYLLMFTAAGGQTVGKMLMGLRVVGDAVDSIDEQLTMAQAALRAVLAPLSVLALGLGWLPALFGRGLALHDRLAHTRVIRA